MGSSSSAIIVGAGAIGLGIAIRLAERGWHVSCYEAGQVGDGCTRASLGLIFPIQPGGWCRSMERMSLTGVAMFPKMLEQLEADTGIGVPTSRPGLLEIAEGRDELELLFEAATSFRAKGVLAIELDGQGVAEYEPTLARVEGGVFYPEAFHVDCSALLDSMKAHAEMLGVQVFESCSVDHIVVESGRCAGVKTARGTVRADRVVLATGSGVSLFDEIQGKLVPSRGQVIVTRSQVSWVNHLVYVRNLDIIPREDGTVLVGATQEMGVGQRQMTVGGVLELLQSLTDVFRLPSELEVTGMRAGVRAVGEDGFPLIGTVDELPDLVACLGLYRNGVNLMPSVAEEVADSITTGDWSVFDGLEPSRF